MGPEFHNFLWKVSYNMNTAIDTYQLCMPIRWIREHNCNCRKLNCPQGWHSYTLHRWNRVVDYCRMDPDWLLLKRILEFFLNDFLWIQRIQWIMTKSKGGMVTKDILYLAIDTLLDVVVKKKFSLLTVIWYLFRVLIGNRYLPRGINENILCITSTGNVSVARWVIPLVTILL